MRLVATKGWFVLAVLAAAMPFARYILLNPQTEAGAAIFQGGVLLQAVGVMPWYIVVGLIYHLILKISDRPEMIWLPLVHLFSSAASISVKFYIDIQRMAALQQLQGGNYDGLFNNTLALATANSIFVLLGYLCFGIALVLAIRRFDNKIPATFD